MKVPKHILLRLLFLSAVLFCLGLEVCTYYNTPICNTELSCVQDYKDNIVLSEVDSFEDDHINQVHDPYFFIERLIVVPILNDSFLLKEFFFSSWQPPKTS